MWILKAEEFGRMEANGRIRVILGKLIRWKTAKIDLWQGMVAKGSKIGYNMNIPS